MFYELMHQTTYRYREPVSFDTHRAIFLPSSAYSGRILSHSLETNIPSRRRWLMDTLSNNVAELEFDAPNKELEVTFKLKGQHFGIKELAEYSLSERAKLIPVQYTPDEWNDLAPFIRPHTNDPNSDLSSWARNFVSSARSDTVSMLQTMMDTLWDEFDYQSREAEGTQTPAQTLSRQSGTCRDYAWLMIEALRRIGFACRFISGYLYDPSQDTGEEADEMDGSGATHAWLQVYLPGAGWRSYDPTNCITSGTNLIQVAIARHPGQAIPLSGAWSGNSDDYLGMDVSVNVRKIDPPDSVE